MIAGRSVIFVGVQLRGQLVLLAAAVAVAGGRAGQLSHLKDGAFTFVHGLQTPNVKNISQAPDGSLWLAQSEAGIAHLQDGKITYIKATQNASNIHVDRRGRVWIGDEAHG